MPDPTDPAFLPRIPINRSDFSTGLNWLGGGYAFQPNSQHDWKCESQSEDDWEEEDSGCDKNHNNLPSWAESLSCDTNADEKCSYNSFCDRFSDQTSGNQWNQRPSTSKCKHSYYDCCVKVSASKLLDHWLDDHKETELPVQVSSIESAICQKNPLPLVMGLLEDGVSLQGVNSTGQNALHILLGKNPQVKDISQLVQLLVEAKVGINENDDHGDSPLTMVRHMLEDGKFKEAAEVAEILLEQGADPNHRNVCGWSALAYSVIHQDSSLNLTRSLLNCGGKILPIDDKDMHTDQPYLPLRVLLRSVIKCQSLDNARESIKILGQVMSQNPKKMKEHVLSSIVAEGSLITSNGPALFKEIQSTLSYFWLRPKPLLHLSLHASRSKLGLKRLNSGSLKGLFVAPRIQNYLSFKTTLPLIYSQTQNTRKEKTETSLKETSSPQIPQETLSNKIRIRLTCKAQSFSS